MIKSVEEARRELFCAWAIEQARSMSYSFPEDVVQLNGLGDYAIVWVQGAWLGFNAALDAVEIKLPTPIGDDHGGCIHDAATHDSAVSDCRAAIEQTGLGLRVL